MRHAGSTLAAIALLFGAAACSQQDSIDPEGAIYSDIAADATIKLSGTEPFWSLTITPIDGSRHQASYSTPDNIEGAQFEVERFAGNNGLGFNGELDGKPVQVAITPGECSDGMSDHSYPFVATLAMGEQTLFGCAEASEAPATKDVAGDV